MPFELKTLSGVVERITYQNDETGYTVAKLLPERGQERAGAPADDPLVTVVGALVGANPGEALELKGVWQHHADYGWQFKVETYRSVLPATAQGIRKYLGSGLVKGVGPKTADKIVAAFGERTLDVLESEPGRLREVRGLGAVRIARITAAWAEQKAIKEVMIFLQGHEVSTSLAVRIYKQYGEAAITVVKNQPYRLAREVWGIGFKTADKIALALGFTRDDPERLKAGALFVLSEAADDGHTYLPRPQLTERAAELLGAPAGLVERAVDGLVGEQGAAAEALVRRENGTHELRAAPLPGAATAREPRAAYDATPAAGTDTVHIVFLPPFHAAEQSIARHLRRLVAARPDQDKLAEFRRVDPTVMFDYLAQKESLGLSERQRDGVMMALTCPASVLTGGPGTGKTTSMRALIRALTLKRKSVVLAAPTGRAAKRLSEATGLQAKTLHRLLQLKPGGKALMDQNAPMAADMVIVDETSMLDTLLMNTLLKAVGTGTHILFVGDADQLPSVGAGNVLADLIASGALPVTRLDQIFRQAEGSAIVTNAHRINRGEFPLSGPGIDDFFFFAEDDPEKAAALVVDLVSKRIPARFGIAPRDVQVLVPTHRGALGVSSLNQALQAALNPPDAKRPQRAFGGRVFRAGDKVLQLVNNYDKDVFNGDAGVITGVDAEDQTVRVQLDDDRVVEYDFSELDQLALAYAVSVHKSQGSEYPACVIPLAMSHYMLLERRLIYTAVTRAKRLVVLVGSRRALAVAVRNGPQTAGPQTAGPQTAGPQTAGPQTAGPQTAGPQTAEPRAEADRANRSARYTALALRLRDGLGAMSDR